MSALHFMIGGKHLGTSEVPAFREDATFGKRSTESVAWFCPRCGEVWARLAVVGSNYTQCWSRPCAKHGDGRIDSPSRYDETAAMLREDWPPAVLSYVLLRDIEFYERNGYL